MSDIFISYTRKDRPRAEVLAHALERQGWTVWWDRVIPAGRTFDEVIEEAIDAARCVVVLWSKISAPSRWVRTEAEEGARRNVLVPVRIEDTKIPLAFRRIQAADLTAWTGEESAPEFERLVVDIAAILGLPPRVEAEERHQAAAEVQRRADGEARRKAEVEEERRRDEAKARREAEVERKRREAAARAAPWIVQVVERDKSLPASVPLVSPLRFRKRVFWVAAAAVLCVVLVAIVRPWFLKPVPTASLQAGATQVEQGNSTVLTWRTTDATEIRLEPGPGLLEEVQGSIAVTPDRDTGYKLVAEGPGGKTEATVWIKVVTPKPVFTPERAPGETFRDCEVCPDMVVVPAGDFSMGSPPGEAGRNDNEGPQHKVSIAPFALGKYEVTRKEFAAYALTSTDLSNGCLIWNGKAWDTDETKSWRDPGFPQADDHPVTCVSLEDAKKYGNWLSRKTGYEYRLASEAEWEYAARAGTKTARFWGDEPDSACGFANVADLTAKASYPGLTTHDCKDEYVRTAPVGSFQANGFGLYDMLGNVMEWTGDCWNGKYVGAPEDGSAWETGSCSARAARGGSWLGRPRFLRSAIRYEYVSLFRLGTLGFRVARALP